MTTRTAYRPVSATRDTDAWAAIARTVLPGVLAAGRVQSHSRPMGVESTYRAAYARTDFQEGECARGGHYYDAARSAWQCRDCDTAVEDCSQN